MSKHRNPGRDSCVHPIATLLIRSLRPAEDSEFSISAESLREIRATLEQLVQTPEFLPAVTTVVRFCKVLEARGAGAIARAIVSAAQSAVPELERLTGAHSLTHAAAARERFARLLGDARPAGLPMAKADRGRAIHGVLALRASSSLPTE